MKTDRSVLVFRSVSGRKGHGASGRRDRGSATDSYEDARTRSPSPSQDQRQSLKRPRASTRSRNFWILPVEVFGISAKITAFGTLKRASSVRQCTTISSRVADLRG